MSPHAAPRWPRLTAWGDALLGKRCRLGCGERVYPKDVKQHEADEHAGDRIWGES